MVMQVNPDPDKKLQNAWKDAILKISDLTVPLTLISQSWFKSNLAIFQLIGPGRYADYLPGMDDKRPSPYEVQKIKELGSQYPMLKYSGKLERSITDPSATGAISQILNRASLLLGTNVTNKKGAPYALFVSKGFFARSGRYVPARPAVLYGSEQVSPSGLNSRVDAWVMILGNWAAAQTGAK